MKIFLSFSKKTKTRTRQEKTCQDVALFKTFLRERKLNDPEELTPLQLDASWRQFIVSVRKQDGSDYEPSSLRCMVASIERYQKKKSYGFGYQCHRVCRCSRGSKSKAKGSEIFMKRQQTKCFPLACRFRSRRIAP